MTTNPLTLMAVHAHPDDESIGTGGILAKYALEGIRTVLVTCTQGELGEVQDPTYVPPSPGIGITDIRKAEMAEALKILKISHYINLAYKDSGMAGTLGNQDPQAFCQTDVEAAAKRLAHIIRIEKPHVIVTYDENGVYGHPDHIMTHRITQKAFTVAGDTSISLPDSPPAWQPRKLYYLAIPMERIRKYRNSEEEKNAPGASSAIIGTPEDQITTYIDVTSVLNTKFDAIFVHRSQIASNHLFRRLSQEQRVRIFGREYFVCIKGCRPADLDKEHDLFEGLR